MFRINFKALLSVAALLVVLAMPTAVVRAQTPGSIAGLSSAIWRNVGSIADPHRWRYWQGTYVRIEEDGNLSCHSPDGRNCDWRSNSTVPPAGSAQPLVCGARHRSLYGISGYDQNNHWCNKAFAELYAEWHGAVARNAAGDLMCYSRDGVNCLNGVARTHPIVPLVCGEGHRAIWGITGYDSPGHWCNQAPRFTLAVTSDPQYPWKNEGDIPSSGNDEVDSQASIPLQYASINRFHETKSPISGVIVNGDVTAFGHGWQWDYMHRQLGALKPPVFMGLGNHDYQNNVNDCAQNGCVRNSLNAFERYLPSGASVDRQVNYYYEFPTNVKEFKGSYAWSKDIKGVHFVFLNNEPTYSFEASGYNAADARTERFNIKSAIPWLDADLSRARAAGKPIVLVYHKPSEFKETDGYTRARFEDLVRKYKVSLIFWGHYHQNGVAPQASTFGGAPAVYSGSASTQTYLIANFDALRGYADVYLSKKGSIDAMPLVVRASLKSPVESTKPEPKSYDVRFVNNGGYVAFFRLQYATAQGQQIQHDSGNKAVGQAWSVVVPAGATGVRATAWAKSGLVWDPWPTVFTNQPASSLRCFKVYGTTLHRKWGDC